MNPTANNIKQRMSLREPLGKALDVVVKLTDKLSLKKPETDGKDAFLKAEMAKAQEVCPLCKDFERDFPSFAFSIATGIGKTRLMGACIAYLYLKKGIRHFFVLAPNLTLYQKLIRDFGDPSYEKYVFKGVSEFVHNQPVVITGDNYDQAHSLFSDKEIQINVFNISKFNTDSKESKKGAPKMKRLSEYLGQSYFNYLANLKDLVILMDEAHRYHADASRKAINELNPVLGLEMTATPYDESGKSFKNIVYEYNLAEALAEGKYVKNPTIAKRRNFEKKDQTPEELDVLKLEDAISVHEHTKLHLELYAKENNVPFVKPFILVVCKNIQHAKETVDLIENRIYEGKYKGKVLQIDSSTKKNDEIDQQFVSLEDPKNQIEIVVHVNMLKEGWDVTNLYTIVPLRAADAITLVEQTIGRGLRLPYGGKRTGNAEVDKLTVIAHENFDEVIKRAQDPKSLLNKMSYIELDDEELKPILGQIVKGKTTIEEKLAQERLKAEQELDKAKAKAVCDARQAVWDAIPKMNTEVKSKEELAKPENIKKLKEITEHIIREKAMEANPLFAEEEAESQIKEVMPVINVVVKDYIDNIIEIPRVVIEQPKATAVFHTFDLDTSEGFSFPELNNEIVRMGLKDNEVEVLTAISSGYFDDPLKEIVAQLMNFEEVDYDENAELLYHLAGQAIDAVKRQTEEGKDVANKVHQFKMAIANRIYSQMKEHFTLEKKGYASSRVLPFVELLPQHLTEETAYGYRDYRIPFANNQKSLVKKYIFTGFLKSYYLTYKFDSSTELDFAYLLEHDDEVLRWLRPVPNQFRIYWGNGTHRYEPDFVVETKDAIYMVETKANNELKNEDVVEKKKAALEYCSVVSKGTSKLWKYVLIPHNAVGRTMQLRYLIGCSL
ncbi:MAG: DEAD/DEAH box helicase family protein [Bacteroidales bacterium]|nr:DEAD/DEAH box helicase family protein [Bacteroidales bacterium]